VAPVLFVIAAVGGAKTGNPAGTFAVALLQAAVALVVIVGLGRLALRPLFHLVAATRSPELFMAACLLVVVTTSMFAAVSGLSMALGAFIAGLLLAETEYRRAIEAMINPFQGLLLGVFFVSVGMGLDLTRLIQSPVVIIGAALGLIGLKAAIIHGLGRLFHVAPPAAAESGLLLGPGGEFAFVIVGAAATAGLLREEPGQQALVIATVSMVALPALARLGQRINRRLRDKAVAPAEPPPAPEPGGVIVAGYGRVGQLVGEMLKRHNVPYLAIDLDATRVRDQRNRGNPVYFGDSANPEFLRSCGIETARALVVTLDSARAVEAVVAAARAERRDLTIVARARDARHAMALYELGVDDAVPENFEASLQLSEAVLVDIGVPMGLVIASVHERRDEFRNTLKRVDDTGAVREPEFRGRRTTRVAKGG
jgi:CPA2 family monovalent cation:H+ antiporter-2